MNTPAFLRQNAELISLVVLLVVAFLLKNIDTTALISAQTDRLKTASESAAANYTKGGIITQPNTTPWAVSSANAAASISHAIESSLRPKVVPLPNFSAINDVKTKKIKLLNNFQR